MIERVIDIGQLQGLGGLARLDVADIEVAGSVAAHASLTMTHGISAFGATLVDDASAAAARSTLALGTAALSASGDFATAGHNHSGVYQPLAVVLTNTTAAFTTAQETKLSGVATGATANSSDATLLDRANHTGTQTASTVSDFSAAADARVAVHAALTVVHGISTFGGTLVDDADAAAARTTLGLGTAATTASTAYEAAGGIATHAALTAVHGITAFGGTLVDDADAAAARTTLGLGGAAVLNVGTAAGTVAAGDHTHAQLHDAVTVADSTTIDLTLTGQQVSAAAIVQLSIASDASGIKLSGDVASPGNSYLYGTNGSGVKGWYVQPGGAATDTAYSPGSFTVLTETSRIAGPQLKMATTERITAEGTGRLRVYN